MSQNYVFKSLKFFKWIGLMPYNIKEGYDGDRNCVVDYKIMTTIILQLTLYWIGIAFAFKQATINNDLISRIINHFQMILNGIALTIVFVTALRKVNVFDGILKRFRLVDEMLGEYGIDEKQRLQISEKHYYTSLKLYTVYMIIYHALNLYNYFQRPMQPFWYYIIVNIPIIFNCGFLLEGFSMITFLKHRCCIMKEIVEGVDLTKSFENKLDYTKEYRKIFGTMNLLIELYEKIDEYFGESLLAIFAAFFTISTVQCYYLYLIVVHYGETGEIDVISTTQLLSMIVTCFIITIGITWICEQLSESFKTIMSNLSKVIKNSAVRKAKFLLFQIVT